MAVEGGVAVGLGAALAAALASNLGFLWRHRGANQAPDVDVRHPLKSAAGLFRQKWWTVGYVTAAIAWALHVGALSLAPVSLVQAVLASGIVFLAVLADRAFGFRVGRREWAAIGLIALGLAFVALTAGEAAETAGSSFKLAAVIAFEGALVALGLLCILSGRLRGTGRRAGIVLAAAAGTLFAVTHIAIKALSGAVEIGTGPALEIIFTEPAGLVGPLGGVVLLAGIAAFYASARSLQLGEAVPVIAVTSVAGNAFAILGGVIVFGDPIGNWGPEITARVGAFTLVIIATAMIPGPLRAASRSADKGARASGAEAPA
jgi:drug/metabolite transporter (DMT)-like permease